MKHSPLPWSAHSCDAIATDQDSGERFIEIMAGPVTFSPFLGYRNGRIAHGEHVASVWGRGEDNTIRNANAALIVHRVNTYDALVEALEASQLVCTNHGGAAENMTAFEVMSQVHDTVSPALELAKDTKK